MPTDPPRVSRQAAVPGLQQELANHLETLRDLGPEYTEAVAAALVDELNPLIEAKVHNALSDRGKADVIKAKRTMVAVILGISIPLLGIAGGTGGVVGIAFMAVAMFIIVVVAMTHDF